MSEPGYPDSVVDANGKDVVVSCMTVTSNSWAEGVANARLIAEAPAMAALLRRVADHFQDTDAPLGMDARALLARLEAE